jgi:transposase
MQKRKRYKSEFKSQVALEALKEMKTLSELATQFSIHANQISDWKKQLQQGAQSIFETDKNLSKDKQEQDTEKEQLYAQIGKLQVELEWLKKKLKNSGAL